MTKQNYLSRLSFHTLLLFAGISLSFRGCFVNREGKELTPEREMVWNIDLLLQNMSEVDKQTVRRIWQKIQKNDSPSDESESDQEVDRMHMIEELEELMERCRDSFLRILNVNQHDKRLLADAIHNIFKSCSKEEIVIVWDSMKRMIEGQGKKGGAVPRTYTDKDKDVSSINWDRFPDVASASHESWENLFKKLKYIKPAVLLEVVPQVEKRGGSLHDLVEIINDTIKRDKRAVNYARMYLEEIGKKSKQKREHLLSALQKFAKKDPVLIGMVFRGEDFMARAAILLAKKRNLVNGKELKALSSISSAIK